jgi:hypothetical protein
MKLVSLLVGGAALATAEKLEFSDWTLKRFQASQFIEPVSYIEDHLDIDDSHSRSKRGTVSSWRFYRKCLRGSISSSCKSDYEEFAENAENAFGESVVRATEEAGSIFKTIPDRMVTRRVWAAYVACHNNQKSLNLDGTTCSNFMKNFLESYGKKTDCSAFGEDADWSNVLKDLYRLMDKSDKPGKPQHSDNDQSHYLPDANAPHIHEAPPRAQDCSAFLTDDLSDADVGTVYTSEVENANPSGLGVYQLNNHYGGLMNLEKITKSQGKLFAACKAAMNEFNTCNKCLLLAEHNKTEEVDQIISKSSQASELRAFLDDPESSTGDLYNDYVLGTHLVTCTGMNYKKDASISGSSFTTQQCCNSVGQHSKIMDTVYIPVRELGFNNLPGIPIKMFGKEKTPGDGSDVYTIPLDWVQNRGYDIYGKLLSTECDEGFAENPAGKTCVCANYFCRPVKLKKSPGKLTAKLTAAKKAGADLKAGKIGLNEAGPTFFKYTKEFNDAGTFVNNEEFPAFFWTFIITNPAAFKGFVDSMQLTPFFTPAAIDEMVADYKHLHVTDPTELYLTTPGNRMVESMKRAPKFVQGFSDARTQSEEFWDWYRFTQLTINAHTMLVKADADNVKYLKAKFDNGRPENKWDESWSDLADEGNLYFIDVSLFEHAIYDNINNWWAPATITLLKRTVTDGKVNLLPFAVRVSNVGDKESYVYEESDGSTYIMALIGVRASLGVIGIELNHITGYHIATGLATGTFQAATNGQKRTVLNDIFEKHFGYGGQFNTFLFTSWEQLIAPLPNKADRVNHVKLLNHYMNRTDRGPLQWNIKHALKKNRLDPDDFTNEGDIAWSGYYSVADGLKVFELSENYIKTMIDSEFDTDSDVANDETIRIWETLLTDPAHGNLIDITDYGRVNGRLLGNKAQLTHFLTSIMTQVMQHGRTRLETGMNTLTQGRYVIHISGNDMFKKPSDSYTVEEILGRMPDLHGLGQYTVFMEVFCNTRPYGQMFPNGDPKKDGRNWFTDAGRSKTSRRVQNKAGFDLARDAADWLSTDMWGNTRVINGQKMTEGSAKYIDQLKQYPFKIQL